MSLNSVSAKAVLPYAEALLDSSQRIELLDETTGYLSLILESIEQSSQLKSFLVHPLFGAEAKKSVLSKLFADQVSCHVLNFLYILVDRRRMVLLQQIIHCYRDLVHDLKLVLVAEVSTAFPLNEQQKQTVQDRLKDMTGSSKIQLVEYISPELIGGLMIKIGSKVIDLSIYGRLSQISTYLSRTQP